MSKFKALIAEKGNYCYNGRFVPYKNSEVITEDKDEAEYLRNNTGFIEIGAEIYIEVKKEDMEIKLEVKEVESELAEIEELKEKAKALGLKFHHKIGYKRLKKLVVDFLGKVGEAE